MLSLDADALQPWGLGQRSFLTKELGELGGDRFKTKTVVYHVKFTKDVTLLPAGYEC